MSSPTLHITTEQAGHVTVLTVAGDIDALTAPQFREAVDTAIEQHTTALVLDLTSVAFMDSMGLRVITSAWRRLPAHGRMAVGGASATIERTLRLVDPEHRIPLYRDTATAVVMIGSGPREA
ncbi:STAS domain-containing protein [Herbidospora cretacea]|uniref:STAS domain-containing protein n=1 Tax=Herbidospora cretacea TaxID=28444 RepID=UPI00068AE919|nr:STAS domain-containing protein [Herbidospora cretacea]